jgi:hypothetical protein
MKNALKISLALASVFGSIFSAGNVQASEGCTQPGFEAPTVYQRASGYWRGVNSVYSANGELLKQEKFEDNFEISGSELKITAKVESAEAITIRGTFDCLGQLSVKPQENLQGWFTSALASNSQIFLETNSPNGDTQIFETFSVASDKVISASRQVYKNGFLEQSSFGTMEKVTNK